MANRYPVSANGFITWDGVAGTKWSTTANGAGGSAVPTATDDVFVVGGIDTINISGARVCKSLTTLGSRVGFESIVGGSSLTISGNVTLSAETTLIDGSGFLDPLVAFSININGTGNIKSNGVSWKTGPITINGSGISVTFDDDFKNSGALSPTLTLTQGTLNARANMTLGAFSSSGSSVRAVNMGGGIWNLNDTGIIWDYTTTTNLTHNANNSIIFINDSSTTDKIFVANNQIFNDINFSNTANGLLSLTKSVTCNNFIIDVPAPQNVNFSSGISVSCNNFIVNGDNWNSLITLHGTIDTNWTLNVSTGNVIVNWCTIRNSQASGGANFVARNSINEANNSGWNFVNTAPQMMSFF